MINAVFLDLSGVIYQGKTVLPGACDAVVQLRRAGLFLRFLTNTTRATKQAVLENLQSMGLECDICEVFTPAQAACAWLRHNKRTPYLLVHPDLKEEFQDCSVSNQYAVVVGDAGHAFSYDELNKAFRVLLQGADFLALAENRNFKDSDGCLSLDAGPFIHALEFATRRSATLLGKPSRSFFEAALDGAGCGLDQAVMVGDDAESDVSGALHSGLGYALLVRTGKYRPNDELAFSPPPTDVVDDISTAASWILDHHK
ncbi:MAG: TIGR01458 family HAD-type hydrolase [Alphaproteobacteria bacterium]|nr:TIGR01458 family HAD-type hydrolase [Alphaproteobacteria bacterium]